jgi:hypothetical protein
VGECDLQGRSPSPNPRLRKRRWGVSNLNILDPKNGLDIGVYLKAPKLLRWLTGGAKTSRGPVVLGIREISPPLTFESSYTLIEHAGKDSIDMEVKSYALEQVRKHQAAVEERPEEWKGRDPILPAKPSASAQAKKRCHETADGLPALLSRKIAAR